MERVREAVSLFSLPLKTEQEMRFIDGLKPIGREMSGSEISEISKSSLNLTSSDKSSPNLTSSDISLAQQQGHAAVDLYRIWWEKYDKMTRGDEGADGWGRMKEGEEDDKMSSTFLLCLIAFVLSLSFLMVMVVVVLKKCRRRRAAKLSSSTLSLPPPYEMVVEEKERLAIATGLPSYKEACPNSS